MNNRIRIFNLSQILFIRLDLDIYVDLFKYYNTIYMYNIHVLYLSCATNLIFSIRKMIFIFLE